MEEWRILFRDFRREWRGESPSKYPGVLLNIRNRRRQPDRYDGHWYADFIVGAFSIPHDLYARVSDLVAWQRKRVAFRKETEAL
jgi:hypothetical protein